MIFVAVQFNADLYVAAVTVIPVYFIALLMPGGLLRRYARWAKLEERQDYRSAHGRAPVRRVGRHAPGAVSLLRMLPATLSILLSGVGAVEAALALEHRHASAAERMWTTDALLVLPILAVATAFVSLIYEARLSTDPNSPLHAGSGKAEKRSCEAQEISESAQGDVGPQAEA